MKLLTRAAGMVLSVALVLSVSGCGGGYQSHTTTPTPALAITSATPPSGGVGTSYAGSGFSLRASGGAAPYQWSWIATPGSFLPGGLNLSASGLITGALTRALDSLPEKYRTVLILRDIQHLSITETAQVLGLSEANVKTRLCRARLQMRDALAPGFDGAWSRGRTYEKVRPF